MELFIAQDKSSGRDSGEQNSLICVPDVLYCVTGVSVNTSLRPPTERYLLADFNPVTMAEKPLGFRYQVGAGAIAGVSEVQCAREVDAGIKMANRSSFKILLMFVIFDVTNECLSVY